ncbi:hypothetical protein Sango_0254900 [Sesamum angolense]|uniref:Integrase catalytic domain-containing protein n=1 Tax=Sesamum angolense TaxID=2727404 RepID=A0AAE1XHE7_9LAMI|nr:hypothetical protein Sango_0254900 [Sesamum angolense]
MGNRFLGPFLSSFCKFYIILGVDYVSKWVEAKATRTDDAKIVVEFVKANIFSRFGMPRAIISDRSTHFCNTPMRRSLVDESDDTEEGTENNQIENDEEEESDTSEVSQEETEDDSKEEAEERNDANMEDVAETTTHQQTTLDDIARRIARMEANLINLFEHVRLTPRRPPTP